MKNKLAKFAAVAAVAVALTQTVQAVPITGNIGFTGKVQLDTSSVGTATQALNWYNTVVNGTFGTFATAPFAVADGTSVAITAPWTFNSGPVGSFWQVGGYTFNLNSSTAYVANFGGTIFLNVVLTGVVVGNGFDATTFTGTFQVANPASDGASQFTERLSFNSVPDSASTLLLLGGALTGLGLLKRKFVA